MSTTGPLGPAALEPWHHHDHHCYWDHTRCGWVCPPAAAPPAVPTPPEAGGAEPAPVPEPPTRAAL